MIKSWKWMLLVLPMTAHANELIAFNQQQMQVMGITVGSLAPASPVMSNQLPGEIVLPVGQERIVSAPQSGLIDSVQVAAGQTVKRGQVLAHLTSPDLVALQRDYLQAQTQQRLSKNMLERDRELFKDGIIAERRLLTTQSNHDELSVTLAQRRQTLKLSGLGDEAIRQLDSGNGSMSGRLTITAPTDGVVLEQMATAGQRVDASMPLYRIGRLKPLWLEIHAPLDILNYVKEGMGLTIPKYQAQGKIITIIRSVNKNDQTVHLRAEIVTGAEKLSPGQYVEAELMAAADANQFSVPKSAVVRSGQKNYVFVQTPKGFTALPVSLINEQAEHIVVTGKLGGGEKVAVTGTVAIKAAWAGIGRE
jgi:RND family efflux transporter MFP subunit